MSDKGGSEAVTYYQKLPPMVAQISTGERITYAVVRSVLAIFSICAAHEFQSHNGFYISVGTAFLFLGGLFSVAGSIPGASQLRLALEGISVRSVFATSHVPWTAFVTITETYQRYGRNNRWSILGSTRAGSGFRDLFVLDIYRIKSADLINVMLRFWNHTNQIVPQPDSLNS